MEKVRDEEGEVTGYKAYSKNYPELLPAEAEKQFGAVQGFHRRIRVYQQTESAEKANSTDVSATSKDPLTHV